MKVLLRFLFHVPSIPLPFVFSSLFTVCVSFSLSLLSDTGWWTYGGVFFWLIAKRPFRKHNEFLLLKCVCNAWLSGFMFLFARVYLSFFFLFVRVALIAMKNAPFSLPHLSTLSDIFPFLPHSSVHFFASLITSLLPPSLLFSPVELRIQIAQWDSSYMNLKALIKHQYVFVQINRETTVEAICSLCLTAVVSLLLSFLYFKL